MGIVQSGDMAKKSPPAARSSRSPKLNARSLGGPGKWRKVMSTQENVAKINQGCAMAATHCPLLKGGGWTLRVNHCHVDEGIYPRGRSSAWHSHSQCQIEIVLFGKIRFSALKPTRFDLAEGDILVLPPDVPHRWEAVSAAAMLGISMEAIPGPDLIRSKRKFFQEPFRASTAGCTQDVQSFMSEVFAGPQTWSDGTVLGARLLVLLSAVMKHHPAPLPGLSEAEAPDHGSDIVADAVRFLEANLSVPINPVDAARAVQTSDRNLRRLFLKHLGQNFSTFLMQMRLENAWQMLTVEHPKPLIKEVPFRSGFKSQSHFSHSFAQHFGISPTEVLSGGGVIKQHLSNQSAQLP
jgi:AraC-like DNA-binding protein/mannose-6-phosphate isomerase-like protein (cupin superfamily)